MKIAFATPGQPDSGSLAVGILADRVLTESAQALDAATDGAIGRALAGGKFEGKKNTTLSIEAPHGLGLARILLVGLGSADEIDDLRLQAAGGAALRALGRLGEITAAFAVDTIDGCSIALDQMTAEIAFGAQLGSYRFTKYRTKTESGDADSEVEILTMLTAVPEAAEAAWAPRARSAEGVFLARDLVSEPGNVKFPAAIVEDIKDLADIGVDVEILDQAKMAELGMGAMLGVSQGSRKAPYIAVMRWNGAPNGTEQAPVALVGKGVTFDTGGISLKPAGGMEEMKYDMGGAGAVIGAMKAIAGRAARAKVVGVVGLVENMPDGDAQRPGDVVYTMSGQTIEVINTDAEGRLVLADVLYYTQTVVKPRAMVNLATLTGAMVVTLGTHIAGIFANDDELAEQLQDAGAASGENVWRLPLDARYDKEINSDIADMKNVGKSREAGSIAGAQLLQRFVGDTRWVHIDIAGMAWMKRGDDPLVPKGAAGFGVRLLDRLVADNFEG